MSKNHKLKKNRGHSHKDVRNRGFKKKNILRGLSVYKKYWQVPPDYINRES